MPGVVPARQGVTACVRSPGRRMVVIRPPNPDAAALRWGLMPDPPPAGSGENEATWRALLLGTDPQMARTRARLKHLPSEPRCKMCAAPFGGIGYPLMRILGRDRWTKNPKYCRNCFNVLAQ